MANVTHRVLTLNLTSTTDETLTLDPIPLIGSANIADESIINDDISGNANIAFSKLADVSGTQMSIEDFVLDLSSNVYTAIDNISDDIADETTPGYVSITAQKFAGAKTFKDVVTIDEHQESLSYATVLNAPIKPFFIAPIQDLSGLQYTGGAYYKYVFTESITQGNTNAIALVTQDLSSVGVINTSFFSEFTFLAKTDVSSVNPGLTYSAESTTTKLILTCTGFSVVNTVLGENHITNNLRVTTETSGDTFLVLINGIRFHSVLVDFFGANNIWKIHSISIGPSTDAVDIISELPDYGFNAA